MPMERKNALHSLSVQMTALVRDMNESDDARGLELAKVLHMLKNIIDHGTCDPARYTEPVVKT